MSNKDKKEFQKAVARLGNAAADLTGTVVGGVTGSMIAGPGGAMAGGMLGVAVTHTLRDLGADLMQRVLSPNEARRVGEALDFTISKIEENLAQGLQLRQDDFFHSRPGERSSADEIAEGVLRAAQYEHEEKKLKYYGNLLANLAFRTDIDRPLANQLLRLADRMSYRQLCYTALLPRRIELGLGLTNARVYSYISGVVDGMPPSTKTPYQSLAADLLELAQVGVVVADLNTEQPMAPQLTDLGMLVYGLMSLQDIPEPDLEPTLNLLVPPKWRGMSGMRVSLEHINAAHALTNRHSDHVLLKGPAGYMLDDRPVHVNPAPISHAGLGASQDVVVDLVMLEDAVGNKYAVDRHLLAQLDT